MGELVYRPAGLDDAALASDLMTAAYPRLPEDPVVTRYRWERSRKNWSFGRFIAEMEGRPIAFLDWLHGPPDQDPERHGEVSVYLDVAALDVELLTSMWLWVAKQAEAAGSQVLEGYCGEDEPEMLEAMARAGFERDRQEKGWGLDLTEHGDRVGGEGRAATAQRGE